MALRIAHIGPTEVPVWHRKGGALQRRMVELARVQAQMGDQPLIVSPASAEFECREITVETIGIPCRLPRPWRDYEMAWRARSPLAKFRPQVVHFHGVPHGASLTAAGIPSVLTVDWFRYRGSGRRLGRAVYSRWLSRFAAVTVVSDYCRNGFGEYWPNAPAARTVPNGVNLDQFRPDPEQGEWMRRATGIDPGAPIALYVGRVCEQKGSDTLLDAIPVIRRFAPAAEVVVAGPPSQFGRTEVTPIVDRLVAAGVRYLGAVDEDALAGVYNMCDVFVMPTRRAEMFGMAVAEAEACGKPVVATRVGGLVEVASADSALFVPPGDAAALGQAVGSVLTDPAARARMGAAALQCARRFGWETVATSFRAVYEGALAHSDDHVSGTAHNAANL